MPTSKANNTSALENTDTAARGKDVEVVEESFKANVSTMTQEHQQDQCCLDNDDFHTKSNNNNRSLSDNKVSDDLKVSKNNFVSNGVSSISVQEFNIDVDSEHTADSMAVDANSSPTGKVLPTSKRLSETPSDFVYPKDILDNSIIHNAVVVAENGEWTNNTIPTMTVITHQNSNENIRDIIANSEQANKNTSSDVNNERSHFKSPKIKRNRKLIRSENINECEDEKIEDPIERLNKLRASISSALSEVKGVLKQYSTEQSCDGQNESTPSNEPPDDGPVRFRFVRKIRRRSAFSEDDETEIPKSLSDIKSFPIVENKTSEEVTNELKDKVSSNENFVDSEKDINQDSLDSKEAEKPIKNNIEDTDKKLIQVASEQVPQGIDNVTTKESEIQKNISDKPPCPAAENSKSKIVKTKKVLKKDRRASIAAVEINRISNDQLPKELELKTQRRPSDSGTVVKQPTRVKVKKSEKSKLPSHLKAAKTDSIPSPRSTEIVKPDEKIDLISSPINDQSTTSSNTESTKTIEIKTIEAALIENLPLVEARVSGTPATSLQSTEAPPSCEAEKVLTSPATIVTSTNVKDDSSQIIPSTIDTKTTDSKHSSRTSIESNKADNSKKPTTTIIEDIKTVAPSKDSNMPIASISAKIPEITQIVKAVPVETINIQNQVASVVGSISTDSNENKDVEKIKTSSNLSTKSSKIGQTAENIVSNKNSITELVDSNTAKPGTQSAASETSKKDIVPTASNITKPVTKAADIVQTAEKIIPNKKSIGVADSNIAKAGTKSATKEIPKKTTAIVQSAEKIIPNKKSITITKPGTNNSTAEISKKAAGTLTQINKTSSVDQKVQVNETSDAAEPEEPIPLNVPKDALAVKFNLPGQESVDELQRLEQQQEQEKETSPSQTSEAQTSEPQQSETATAVPPKKKRKAKRKVVIRRIKRKLSKDDTFLHTQEAASQIEICEKEIEEKDVDEEPEAVEEAIEVSKTPKPCIKLRQFEIGDVVMYAEHYKKTQVRWKKAVVTERITSISYKLNIEGQAEERPAHISYIKKFTDRKVNFGGKEYLEIDYEQIAEDEEKERNYSIWNLV